VRVLIADDLPASAVRETARQPVVGRITFTPAPRQRHRPVADQRTPSRRPRHARRPADLRVAGGYSRALHPARDGRALAHEIGHYVLGTREHASRGLMSSSFRPDEVTFGGVTRFSLPRPDAARMRLECIAGAIEARAER
jgi:hypothetical protein